MYRRNFSYIVFAKSSTSILLESVAFLLFSLELIMSFLCWVLCMVRWVLGADFLEDNCSLVCYVFERSWICYFRVCVWFLRFVSVGGVILSGSSVWWS